MRKINSHIEPHAFLLNIPPDGQLLYKIMTVENLLHSIDGSYLHFNRVDSYSDFPGADKNDGKQPPMDRPGNTNSKFEKNPTYSAADYYDQFRAKTYACCFSLENSDHIWNNYAIGSSRGKVCIVFSFSFLRAALNKLFQVGTCLGEYNGILAINYGIVDYVEWSTHQTNREQLQNPIKYIYQKNSEPFLKEKEFRVSLCSLDKNNRTIVSFPTSLGLMFNFRSAIVSGAIQQILHLQSTDAIFLYNELKKRNIEIA